MLSVSHRARSCVYISKCIHFFLAYFLLRDRMGENASPGTIFSPSTVDASIAPRCGKCRFAVFAGAVNIFSIFKTLRFSMRLTGVSLVMRNFANSKRPAGASASAFVLRSVSRSNSVMAESGIESPSMLTVPALSHFSRSGTAVLQCRSKSRALRVCTLGIPWRMSSSLSGASLFDFVNLVIRFAFGDTFAVAGKRIAA